MSWYLFYFQLKDLALFIIILFVTILGYGVAAMAVQYPDAWKDAANNVEKYVINLIFVPYFQVYGELFLENIQGWFLRSHQHPGPPSPHSKRGQNLCLLQFFTWGLPLLRLISKTIVSDFNPISSNLVKKTSPRYVDILIASFTVFTVILFIKQPRNPMVPAPTT